MTGRTRHIAYPQLYPPASAGRCRFPDQWLVRPFCGRMWLAIFHPTESFFSFFLFFFLLKKKVWLCFIWG